MRSRAPNGRRRAGPRSTSCILGSPAARSPARRPASGTPSPRASCGTRGRPPAGRAAGPGSGSRPSAQREELRTHSTPAATRGARDASAPSRLNPKPVDGARAILFPRTQDRRRERGLVGRVGKVLRLHGEAGAAPVDNALLPAQRAVQEVAGIKLQSRLGRGNLHHPAGYGLVHMCGKRHVTLYAALAAPAAFVEHEVVIVAPTVAELLVVPVGAGANRRGRAEG